MTCETQEEQKILTICRENLSPDVFQDIFLLTYDRMRRYEGAWHLERRLLFQGCVFLESRNDETLSIDLEKYRDIDGRVNHMVRISKPEENFLRELCGRKHHLEMSRGVICNGAAQITKGPLKGMENRICKIDRHKRLARVSFALKPDSLEWQGQGNSYRYILAGLEITEKIV